MTKQLRVLYALALLAIVWTLTPAPARAQAIYGTIFGTVTDKTGAVVPNATVTVTDVAKGTVDTVKTNGSGDYTASHLIPDTYDIKIEISGFKTSTTKGVVVQADTAPRVDVALEVAGANAEEITVNADSIPQLKTDRADVSTVFNQQQISNLPVGDQNFTNLQLLLPGAQQLGWSHAASENPQASKQIQVNGQAFGGVAFELDGTDNQDPILGIIVINPALDAVTETKITTQNFDAEFGKAVSSVVTAQTRSGTNKFHGSAYDFRSDNANQARDPYTQQEKQYSGTNPIAPGFKNRFGGSIGGPIWKDRAFFFGNYEAQRQKVGTTATDTLPSSLLVDTCLGTRTGPSGIAGCDFSEYLTNLGPDAGTIYEQPYRNPALSGPTPYAGNVIPAAQLSSQSLALLKYLQPFKPNTTGLYNGLSNNFSASGNGLFNSDQWTVRGDYSVTQNLHAFGRYSRFTDTLTGKVAFGDAGGPGFGIGGFGGTSKGTNQSLATGLDYVFNPKLVADLRIGWYGYKIITSKYDQDTTFADTLGIPGINFGDRFTNGSPGFFIDRVKSGGDTQPVYGAGLNVNRCNCPLTEDESQFQVVSNWTKTLGNHAIKFGADLRFAKNLRVPSDNDRSGVINFGVGPTSNGASGGIGFATFALGEVTSFNRYVSVSTNARESQKRPFFYVQDTWQASHKLTLNLGVRWELYFPESVNAKGNGALMDLDDGYLHVAGYGKVPNDMGWKLEKLRQFQPRIGLAYQLNPKTVIRAGYGRSFDVGVFGSIFGHVVTQNLPVLANQNVNPTGNNTSYAFTLDQGPPSGAAALTQFGAVPANGLLPNPGHFVTSKARPNPLRFPTLDAWNLSMQRAITPSLTVTAAYVANKGTHTLSAGDGNNTSPNESAINLPGSFSVNGQALHYDPNAKVSGNDFYIAPDGGTANQKLLQRYLGGSLAACQDPLYTQPTYGGLTLPAGACGWDSGIAYYGDDQNSNFNALQVTVVQRIGKAASLTSNYQWASAKDFNSSFATWDKSAVYGNNNDVRKHQLTSYGSYELPFGKNRKFLGGANRVTDLIVGGYQLSGVLGWSTGVPYGLTLDSQTCKQFIPDSAPCRPNETGRLKTNLSSFDPVSHTRKFYDGDPTLSKGQFTRPGLDQIGTSPRNSYFGPSFFNTDLSVTKTISIWESAQFMFRADAYNAFNHINPGNPGGDIQTDGVITGQAPGASARFLQLSARIQF